MKLSKLFALLAIVFIASCQSAAKKTAFSETGFHITDVQVSMPPQEATNKLLQYTGTFGPVIDNTISNYAYEYNSTRANVTKPYMLDVNIEKVHFKNAVASLLVGDANRVSGTASLVDPKSNEKVHTFPFIYLDAASGALNGITGAVLSVVVKKEAAEATMSKGIAHAVMKKVFPDVKLPASAKKRLKAKSVHEPITGAMSPLSIGSLELSDEATDEVGISEETVQTAVN